MSGTEALRRVARPAGRRFGRLVTRRWEPSSRLFLVGEGTSWSIDHDLLELAVIARRLGLRLGDRRLLSASREQAVFYGSQFTLLREPWSPPPHRLATAYFHGRPGTPGMPEFDECYRALAAHHAELDRVQVTHGEMHDVVLSTGIDPAKVIRIPIGVNLAYFEPQTPESRAGARSELGLPADAFVVGSFHKDGVGFGEGMQPKLIKGPDVLLETVSLLRGRVEGLVVLLGGPARGFVRAGLKRLGVPYRHVVVGEYAQIGQLYQALDAYLVPSRQEGGPKGVLEAMASGVPVVTTRVGQAAELVLPEENGFLADVEDAEALAVALERVATGRAGLDRLVAAGRATAEEHAYERQLPLWRAFFAGLVTPG